LNKDYYFTIDQDAMAEFKDRGSRFLAYTFPINSIDAFKKRLKEIKADHPKAVHHCYAYRIGIDGNNFRAVDDGEPSGSAGRPILGQIDSRQLTNLAIIVVRYFGGTLLGVPGLINAYKTASSLSLQVIPIVQRPVEKIYKLRFDYTLMNEVMMVIRKYNCSIQEQQQLLFCEFIIGIPNIHLELCISRFQELRGLEMELVEK
jgi:uncharacterized YigZ family protein